MSKFNCEQNCKKTKQLKESSLCTKEAEIVDGKIFFGCEKSLQKLKESDNNFYNCMFWDIDLKSQCNACNLVCDNNKNKDLEKLEKQKESIKNLLNAFGPMAAMSGQPAANINDINKQMNDKNFNPNDLSEVVQITNYARNLLDSVVSGRKVDLAEFQKVKNHIISKYNKVESK